MGVSKSTYINYKRKPQKGDKGDQGPVPIPAGIYIVGEPAKQYVRNSTYYNYVLFEDQFYALNREGVFDSSINPKLDYATNGSNATWVHIPQMDYAFLRVLFAAFAHLGSWIVNGDFMLSQYGVDAQGNPINTADGFKEFSSDMSKFIPNILFNALTGYAHFGHRNLIIHEDGSVEMYGKFATSNGVRRIVIDPATCSLKMYEEDQERVSLNFGPADNNPKIILPRLVLKDVNGLRRFEITSTGFKMINDGGVYHKSIIVDANYLTIENKTRDSVDVPYSNTSSIQIEENGISFYHNNDPLNRIEDKQRCKTITDDTIASQRYILDVDHLVVLNGQRGGDIDLKQFRPKSCNRVYVKCIAGIWNFKGIIWPDGQTKASLAIEVRPGDTLTLISDNNEWYIF